MTGTAAAQPSGQGTMVYLDASPSLDAALERVVAHGGKIALPRQALPPGMGFLRTSMTWTATASACMHPSELIWKGQPMETNELHRGRLIDHVQLVVRDLATSHAFTRLSSRP